MEHVVDPGKGGRDPLRIVQIPLDELDTRPDFFEVFPFAGREVVQNANVLIAI